MSTGPQPPTASPAPVSAPVPAPDPALGSAPVPARGPGPDEAAARTLERRLLGWLLALTVAPALIVLVVGGWALAASLEFSGALGPWEEVGASGRQVVELVEPIDSTTAAALSEHRDALSRSLTQARRWAFLESRFTAALPWLVLFVAMALVALAYAATRQLARQLARPIEELVVVAEHLGRGEALPPSRGRSVHEVQVLDRALRTAATELEAARQRAVSAERLRVWGEMARRVAHEMKNPLTPLRFAAHRLARLGPSPAADASGERAPVPDDPRAGRPSARGPAADGGFAEAVEVIGQEVTRLEELAAQFSSLGRPPEGPATEIDLAELLASLLESDAPDVTTSLEAAPALPPVIGHYDGLFRAFRNLVRNAVEATESVPAPRVDVAVVLTAGADGRWLDVRIRDNGPGLPPGDGERIFEPDFTTKTRGTGLGLALARQAVGAAGGTIRARSRNGGAEFVVRLPAAPSLTEQESQ